MIMVKVVPSQETGKRENRVRSSSGFFNHLWTKKINIYTKMKDRKNKCKLELNNRYNK